MQFEQTKDMRHESFTIRCTRPLPLLQISLHSIREPVEEATDIDRAVLDDQVVVRQQLHALAPVSQSQEATCKGDTTLLRGFGKASYLGKQGQDEEQP